MASTAKPKTDVNKEDVQAKNFASARQSALENSAVDLANRSVGIVDEDETTTTVADEATEAPKTTKTRKK